MTMLLWAMSILARSTWAPSGNSPARIRSKRSRFSSTARSRKGLSVPGVVTVPRRSRISASVEESTYARPLSIRTWAYRYSASK